jgi:hypothetical protein
MQDRQEERTLVRDQQEESQVQAAPGIAEKFKTI